MPSGKSRQDEIYRRGVHDGQRSRFIYSVYDQLAMIITLCDIHLYKIYKKGYKYGMVHRLATQKDRIRKAAHREFSQSNILAPVWASARSSVNGRAAGYSSV